MESVEGSTSLREENAGSCSSSSNPCPVCLGPVSVDSYLDKCFHKFCYSCIVHWSGVVASRHSRPPSSLKCPLCKTDNFSIIHGYDGSSFQRHYFNQDFGSRFLFSKAHKYRLQCYYVQPASLSGIFDASHYWKLRKYLQPNHWLQGWLRREIQALIQEEDVEIVMHHIIGVIDSFRRNEQKYSRSKPSPRQGEFRALVSQAARPFLTGRTDRFVDELELFLASGLTIEAYDKVYIRQLGWRIPEIIGQDEEEGESEGHKPLVPYLYLFDDDESDGND